MTPSPLDLPLRDIHLPASIHWWPLAMGWWILLGLVIALILGLFLFRKFAQRTYLKKQAKRALDRIEHKLLSGRQAIECLSDLSVLLRQLTVKKNPLSDFAGLTGEKWLKFLDQPLDKPEFSQGVGQVLLLGPYQKEAKKEDVSQLIELCRKWIKYL